MVNLTSKYLEALDASQTRKEIPDSRITGLYFIVQPSKKKSWAFRYRVGNRSRKLKLGNFPAIELAEARKLATQCRATLDKGEDPAELRQEKKRADASSKLLIESLVELYLKREVDAKHRSAIETRRLLERRVLPVWGQRPVKEITRLDVKSLLDGVLDEGFPIAANKCFAAIRRFFNWAIEQAYIDETPCKGLKAPAPVVSRDRILSDEEIKWLWAATEEELCCQGCLKRQTAWRLTTALSGYRHVF